MDLDFYQFAELIDIRPDAGSHFIDSMSEPYSEEDLENQVMHSWLDHFKIEFHQVHASGHLNAHELRSLVEKISPKCVFPIHTENQLLFKRERNAVQTVERRKRYALS